MAILTVLDKCILTNCSLRSKENIIKKLPPPSEVKAETYGVIGTFVIVNSDNTQLINYRMTTKIRKISQNNFNFNFDFEKQEEGEG